MLAVLEVQERGKKTSFDSRQLAGKMQGRILAFYYASVRLFIFGLRVKIKCVKDYCFSTNHKP